MKEVVLISFSKEGIIGVGWKVSVKLCQEILVLPVIQEF